MNIIFLLWWWIPTTISAVSVQGKKPLSIINTRSFQIQPQIQPKYQPLAAASGPSKSNTDNLELTPGNQTDPNEDISSPGKQSEPNQVASDHVISKVNNLELNSGKQPGEPQDQAPSGQKKRQMDNIEFSDGKQVVAGGSALSSNIGENVAPADDRPSRNQVQQSAPAPVAQPSEIVTVIPLSKNGTSNSTNSTTTTKPQNIDDADMKKGAQGNSFADTVLYQDLKNVQNRVENLGGDNGAYTCDQNRGPLRPFYHRSKYYVDMYNRYTYEEGRKRCNMHELVLAEIDSMSDFKSIHITYNFQFTAKSFNPSMDRIWLGLNDLEEEGAYKRGDGTDIKFQAYFTTQPDDKDGNEDCTAIGKDTFEGPMGMMDVSCMSKYHLLCMFPPEDSCVNDTREAELDRIWMKHVGVHSLMDMTSRAYSVSTLQLRWDQAFDYCLNRSMKIFDMDHMVTEEFFRTLYTYEKTNIAEFIPVIQYWTAGRFKESHMNAAVYWENEQSVHSGIEDEHRRTKQNFTFSGIFRWNDLKGDDPTGRQGLKRKDLCLTFGFQEKPDDTPFVRNTNCGIPCYFVCSKDHAPKLELPTQDDEK